MRVLIPGGFGYLGGRLAQFLASQPGIEVLLGSRRQSASPGWLPGVQVVQTRWDSPADLDRICDGVDAVVHLAGMNAQDCVADPVAALEVNGLATARLVRAASGRGVARFIYVSTAHVYGSPLSGVITEQTCSVPLHPYATSHRAGEDVVRAAGRGGGIESLVIRLSNSYGAPAHKEANCWMLLVNDLCRQAVTSRSMALQTSGMQRRDFVPLPDVCLAIGHLLRPAVPGLATDIVNLGGGVSMTVWDAACLVRDRCAAVLGFRPTLARVPPQSGETGNELDYRIDVLRRSGFEPGSDRTGEIDRLLEFCAASFA